MKINQDKYDGKIFNYTDEIVSMLNKWGSDLYVDLNIAKKDIKKIKQTIKKLEEHIAEIEKAENENTSELHS
jgi:hypothetical protein